MHFTKVLGTKDNLMYHFIRIKYSVSNEYIVSIMIPSEDIKTGKWTQNGPCVVSDTLFLEMNAVRGMLS